MRNFWDGCLFAVLAYILFTLFVWGIAAVFVTLCWNYVIPYIFGLPTINYLQALALVVVTKLLFAVNVQFKNFNNKE